MLAFIIIYEVDNSRIDGSDTSLQRRQYARNVINVGNWCHFIIFEERGVDAHVE
jgi:hypothetical protein